MSFYVFYVYIRSIFKYKYKNCSECKELLYGGLTNPIFILDVIPKFEFHWI